MKIADINKQLPSGYTAKFVTAPNETVDDEITILLHGVPTRWALQVGSGYIGLNEYGFDDQGEIEWSFDHGMFRTVAAAVTRLVLLLS